MSATIVRGPDYSNWSGHPDFSRVRRAGCLIAGTKASEGTSYRDPTFARNWREMERNGLGRIAYFFAHADHGSSPEAQVDHFVAVVRAAGGWHPWDIPCIDIEAGNLSGAALDAWLNRACLRMEHHWRAGLLYSGNWYLGARGVKLVGPRRRGWHLWTSAYGPRPVIFGYFPTWALWQHTDGRFGPPPHGVSGNGNSDMNIWNGDLAAFLAFAHGGGKPVPAGTHRTPGTRFLDIGNKGTDVAALQLALNHRLAARGKRHITSDGIYGRATETAKHYVEYALGFPLGDVKKRGCSARSQTIIEHPNKRPASYLTRAVARARH